MLTNHWDCVILSSTTKYSSLLQTEALSFEEALRHANAIPRSEEVVYMIDSSYLTKAVAPLLDDLR